MLYFKHKFLQSFLDDRQTMWNDLNYQSNGSNHDTSQES